MPWHHGQAAWVVCGVYIYIYGKQKQSHIRNPKSKPRIPGNGSIYPSLDHCKQCVFCWLKAPGCIWYATRVGKYVLSFFGLNHPTIFAGYSTYPKKNPSLVARCQRLVGRYKYNIYIYMCLPVLDA